MDYCEQNDTNSNEYTQLTKKFEVLFPESLQYLPGASIYHSGTLPILLESFQPKPFSRLVEFRIESVYIFLISMVPFTHKPELNISDFKLRIPELFRCSTDRPYQEISQEISSFNYCQSKTRGEGERHEIRKEKGKEKAYDLIKSVKVHS